MKILTLTQPWATLVAIGAKQIETRAWSTPYRGPIAIHAAKTLNGIHRGATEADLDAICASEPFAKALGYRLADELPRGMILGVVELVDVQPTDVVVGRAVRQRERDFGDYTAGRFGWLLENAVRLDDPIETRGMQGLTTIEPEIAAKVWKQLDKVEARR